MARKIGLLLLAVVVATVLFVFPVGEWLESLVVWARSAGVWGLVVVGAAYIPACILFVPGSILTLGAGFAFGVVKGTIAISIGSTLGAGAAFLVGRTLMREAIEAKVEARPKFKAIDRAVGRSGFKIVLLTRLSPAFPFSLLNYAYGVTGVKFRDYLLASWIGMFPGTVMYVYLGSVVGLAATSEGREKTLGEYILFAVGLIVTIVVTVIVTRIARRALAEATEGALGDEDGTGDPSP